MAKARSRFACQSCGQVFTKWQGQCTACQEWNTIEQEADAGESRRVPMQNPGGSLAIIQTLEEVTMESSTRWATGVDIFDELIGGGLVPGGITLIGGEPGVGKSTFMLQLVSRLGVTFSCSALFTVLLSSTWLLLSGFG